MQGATTTITDRNANEMPYRILCTLERWIKIQFEDFELNSNLLKTLKKFLEVDAHQGGFAFEAGCILEEVNIRVSDRWGKLFLPLNVQPFCFCN